MINTASFKEITPLSNKDCFILIERHKSNFSFPIHVHSEYELNFIEHAKGAQRIVGDSIEVIDEEDLVLITNPHLEHAWKDYQNQSQQIHEITIQFHSDMLTETILNKNQFISIQNLFSRAQNGIVFSKESIHKIRPLILSLTTESDKFHSFIKLLIILRELSMDSRMRELSTNLFATHLSSRKKQNKKLDKAIAYLNGHYPEVIQLSEVADMVNMSKASFCRFMKQHTSKSFVDYLTDIRLGAASRALIDTSLSIAEIGYDCGFNNLSNFNRIFKKRKGLTPSDFRNTYLKNRTIV